MFAHDHISAKRAKALDDADRLPRELRQCVHEYGLPIVVVCIKHGVKTAPAIHELVREIWTGARETSSQPRAPSSTLDWYFSQAGIGINTATLLRLLDNQSLCVVPKMATRGMIEASMGTVADFNLKITKKEKHKRRLDAALEVGAKHLLRLLPGRFRGDNPAPT